MAIYLIAAYVPDGSTVRFSQRRTTYEGTLERSTLHLFTVSGAVPVQRDTLLEIVRFPHENGEHHQQSTQIVLDAQRSTTGGLP